MSKSKPKVAIIGLTSCEGCQFALLDLGKRFLDLAKRIDLVNMRLIIEEPAASPASRGKQAGPPNYPAKGGIVGGEPEPKFFDIVFVEGNPITKQEIKLLKDIRQRTKMLIVLGNCAALGGVWEIKNYHNKEKILRQVYKNKVKVANPDIKEVDNFVKVDFTIPGCPINAEEFLRVVNQILDGELPSIPQRPVCYECQLQGQACLLQQGLPCLGPVSLGGCNAVCPVQGGFQCYACRGLLPNASLKNITKILKKYYSQDEINRWLEIFGVRDDWEEKMKLTKTQKH